MGDNMKIESVWIVTKPGPLSELIDICFRARLRYCDEAGDELVNQGLYLAYQYLGGLDKDSVIDSVWTTEREAERRARKLIKERADADNRLSLLFG